MGACGNNGRTQGHYHTKCGWPRDRSIPSADINRGELLISKRYRNRRLGEYLKELELTEGRSTGIPTIQNVLKANGSPRAIVVTDEERTFFRITIPCHEEAGNIIADIVSRDATKLPNGIVNLINQDDTITTAILAQKTGLSQRTLMRELTALQAKGFLTREGGRKDGKWVILNVNK